MVIQNEITLPTVNGHTVPNYPNFYLGPLVGSGCDTITTSIPPIFTAKEIKVYPNPTDKFIRFELSDALPQPATLTILDALGRVVGKIDIDTKRKLYEKQYI